MVVLVLVVVVIFVILLSLLLFLLTTPEREPDAHGQFDCVSPLHVADSFSVVLLL